jgi:DNA-binding GntR family transcriptional regulator
VYIKLPDDNKREPLRDKIARIIQESVLSGALKPGEQLVEATLARKMNVSRAPLREAFLILERRGYVQVISNQGTYVVNLTPADMMEIDPLRYALELVAAQGASRNLRPDDKLKLVTFLSVMRESTNRDTYRRYCENELLFHQEIWTLSGNQRLKGILDTLCLPLFTFRIANSRSTKKQLVQGLKAHEALLEAIHEGDVTRLPELVRSSIRGLT